METMKEELKQKLLNMTEEEFNTENQRNVKNVKRLYYKLHKHQITISKIGKEMDFYNKYYEKKEELAQKILYNEEINSLKFILEELERTNMDLEYDCLSAPEVPNVPTIKNIIAEFQEQKLHEHEKSKKIGLYIKKEYLKSINEEIEKLESDIKNVNEKIEEELVTIKDLEEKDVEYIADISLVDRLNKNYNEEDDK